MDSIEEPAMAPDTNWQSLNTDLQEQILLRPPVSDCVKAASVSKQWRSIISSESFTRQLCQLPQGKKPWFFLWGINELIHPKSLGFTFDPIAWRWFSVRPSRPPDFNRASLCGADGLFFAFSGSKVCFAPTPCKMKWQQTSPAMSTRCSALLGTFGDPNSPSSKSSSTSPSFRFVVAGGVLGDNALEDNDHRLVEVYNSSSDTWRICNPLPIHGFPDNVSSQWMSSATLGSKFFIADSYGNITVLDVDTGSWSDVRNLQLPDLVSLFIVAGGARLYAVAVCSHQKRCLKVYRVDPRTMNCIEVSQMPPDLFSRFENANEEKETSLKCVGSGAVIYVYDESSYKGYPVCMCDLTDDAYIWRQLPDVPATSQFHFNRVVCCSTTVTPQLCLETYTKNQ